MVFLLDRLKKKFKAEDRGYDDLNYIIGNTSGLDIGQVPSPLDQRIGRMAQIGGSIMEIEIDNPATFQIDRPEIKNVINQLGFERVTLHGDKNLGFTAAYATRGQGVVGYNVVHRYFTTYLEQMASFKKEVNEIEGKFNIGYVNMHVSNEQIPPREEQIASDKSVDPFGMRVSHINGDKDPNIYRNKEFLRYLFDFLLKDQIERYELFQLYTFFENYSDEFEEKWLEARNKVADRFFDAEAEDFTQMANLVGVAGRIDDVDNIFIEEFRSRNIFEDQLADEFIRNGQLSISNISRIVQAIEVEYPDTSEERKGKLETLLRELWKDTSDLPGFSYEAKLSALTRHLDYEKRDIEAPARDEKIGGKSMEHWARETFAGNEDMFSEDESDQDMPPNLKLFERLMNQTQVGRKMEKESTVFFNIIPAWMQAASREYENHDGWDSPEFIWEAIVEKNNPKDRDLKDYDQYQDYLDESRENELNVIAAVAACIIWGHFTQKEDRFDNEAFRSPPGIPDEEVPELKSEDGNEGDYTWIEWMNRFGLKVNFEAMFGDPGQLTRLWRPKDIAVLCHAINMTASNELDDYDENLVKFTIDMEHTSSYGVDPLQEMEYLIEQEEELAREGKIGADPEKPLAHIVRTYHLTKPGWEQQQGHRHGPFTRGDKTLYRWLHRMVEAGFCRNEDEQSIIIFEVGGEYREEIYVMKVAMDMIAHGIDPDDLDPSRIPVNGELESVEEELIARFFGMDKGSVNREWAKIEEHAFDPLDGLLESESWDYTFSSSGAVDQGGNRPNEWKQEEYR